MTKLHNISRNAFNGRFYCEYTNELGVRITESGNSFDTMEAAKVWFKRYSGGA